jgi:hypothetical protein
MADAVGHTSGFATRTLTGGEQESKAMKSLRNNLEAYGVSDEAGDDDWEILFDEKETGLEGGVQPVAKGPPRSSPEGRGRYLGLVRGGSTQWKAFPAEEEGCRPATLEEVESRDRCERGRCERGRCRL